MAALRAIFILLALTPITLLLIPLQWVAVRLQLPLRKRIPPFYHRFWCRMLGTRVTVLGTPAKGGVLITANHSGWLDILVLTSIQPVSFIAKEEINGWPLFGLFARLQETIFVRRSARSKVATDRDRIRDRLLAGDTLVIFPEGTSTDGNRVRPFKSSLLGAAELPLGEDAGHRITHPRVQPVSVAYVGLHGIPMGRENRPFFAWYGDMDLASHLWTAFGLGPIDVVVEFHRPLTVDEVGGRKELAAAAERQVRAGLVRALHGAHIAPPPEDDGLVADLAENDNEAEAA
jgi:1-acyl-sn-glycerol-3-phosphate acyltransferase